MSSITITVDRYGHLFENGDPNTLEAAEQALMGLHAPLSGLRLLHQWLRLREHVA